MATKDEGGGYSWNDREAGFHTRHCKLVECRPARGARWSYHAEDEISDPVKANRTTVMYHERRGQGERDNPEGEFKRRAVRFKEWNIP